MGLSHWLRMLISLYNLFRLTEGLREAQAFTAMKIALLIGCPKVYTPHTAQR
jgi:hypothetical protein